MKRSARSLLAVSVGAAFAVTTAPANAASGASTTLVYEAAAVAGPVTGALPEPVAQPAGQAAGSATGAVDGLLDVAPTTPGARAAQCKLNPSKTVNSHAGTSLPSAPLSLGKAPVGGLPKGDCLSAHRHAGAGELPPPADAVVRVPKTLAKDTEKVGAAVRNSKLGELPAVGTALPGGRRAAVPSGQRSTVVPGVPSVVGPGSVSGVPDVPSALGTVRPAGLPVGTTLFPRSARYAQPGPSDDLVGQTNEAVNQVGGDLDQTGSGVGSVVEVLKARGAVAAQRSADGPLSLPDTSGIGLSDASGVGLPEVPGLG
ncbi:hypothetical protein E1264_31965 [Actinomadura sp. KC216]|uniref:hypothetical protein n=1 Tax=Actinomadura sp. KC216 TaxID=2530370 RepID=UPI0010501A59|nr:hypothetical protein [Actinomadura sp. KC216]TDB82004.1 hypothetical protein E1264_31965 [Actinomadura sp. KC216]